MLVEARAVTVKGFRGPARNKSVFGTALRQRELLTMLKALSLAATGRVCP